MTLLLGIFHVVLAVVLIGVVLLQAGKGADMGATFGAGSSQTLFGPRGAATLLSKVTIVVAALFLGTSLLLARLSRQETSNSVIDRIPVTTTPAPTPQAAPGVEETKPAEAPEK